VNSLKIRGTVQFHLVQTSPHAVKNWYGNFSFRWYSEVLRSEPLETFMQKDTSPYTMTRLGTTSEPAQGLSVAGIQSGFAHSVHGGNGTDSEIVWHARYTALKPLKCAARCPALLVLSQGFGDLSINILCVCHYDMAACQRKRSLSIPKATLALLCILVETLTGKSPTATSFILRWLGEVLLFTG
jgi:hypothetical protein